MHDRRDFRDSDRGGFRGGPRGGHGGHGGGGHRGGGGGYRDGYRDGGRDGYRDGPRERRGTPLSELDPALTEVSRKVIGCAIEVHKELGPGYPVDIYRNALKLMLDDDEVTHEFNKSFEVTFDGDAVGHVIADLYAGGRFLVKLMAEHREIGTQPRSELRAQLRAADLELGLIINFGERRLKDGLVRVLNPDKLREMAGETGEGDEEFEDDDDFEGAEGGGEAAEADEKE